MYRTIYDSVAQSDRLYRQSMQEGSHKLLEAIHWARKGYNPGTSEEAVRLPPDWANRKQIVIDHKEPAVRRPSNERIREMMERGLTAVEIAKEMKCSRQKIVAIMKAIKLELRPDRQMEMIRTGLWG